MQQKVSGKSAAVYEEKCSNWIHDSLPLVLASYNENKDKSSVLLMFTCL